MKLRLYIGQLEKLRQLVKPEEGNAFSFLGYSLNLETAGIRDKLAADGLCSAGDVQVLNVLLTHFASANPVPRTGNLVKFKDLPGGYAYERAFLQRVVQPIAEVFGEKPTELVAAAQLLKGVPLNHGDISVEIPAIEGIPIVYILWASKEFSATASVLFDGSAVHYLPTEDLAVLAELTTSRLKKARALKGSKV